MKRFLLFVLFLGILRPALAQVSFVRDVAPMLVSRCAGCHGDKRNAGGYRTTTFEFLQKTGASGKAMIVAGQPDKSELLRRLVTTDENERMPQADDPLSPSDIQSVRQWIKEGAKFDGGDATAPLKSLLGPRKHPDAPQKYRVPVAVTALAFSPDGQEIFAAGYNEITVWNPQNGALLRRIGHLPQRIQSLIFSPDGKQLLVAGGTPGEYGEVSLIEPQTGKIKTLDTFGDIALCASFNADGTLIAAGGADAGVRAYQTQNGLRLWTNKVHADWVTGLGFSDDGRFLASSSKDMTVKVYEAQSGTLFTTYGGHNRQIGQYRGQAPVYGVQFEKGTPLAVSAGGGKWLQLWNPIKTAEENGTAADMEDRFSKQGSARYIEHGFGAEVFALIVRGNMAFAASGDGTIKQFDLENLKETRVFKGHTDWVFALDYDAAHNRLISGAFDGEVRVWDTQTGANLLTFKAQPK